MKLIRFPETPDAAARHWNRMRDAQDTAPMQYPAEAATEVGAEPDHEAAAFFWRGYAVILTVLILAIAGATVLIP